MSNDNRAGVGGWGTTCAARVTLLWVGDLRLIFAAGVCCQPHP